MVQFHLNHVVTRDIASDIFNGIRNLFGLRLRNIESRIDQTITKLKTEMNLKYNVKWYRIIVNPYVNGSVMIIIYGDGDLK